MIVILSPIFWFNIIFLTGLTILVGFPFEVLRVRVNDRSLYRKLAYYWAKFSLLSTFTKHEVKGLEHVDFTKNYIVMGNHLSFFDIYLVFLGLKDKVVFMTKKELFKIPFFGYVLRRLDFIPVDRDNPREAMKSLIEASKKLKTGDSILMFPEGTRSETGKLQEFKQGGFILAKRSGLDILPFAIKGTDKVLRKNSKKIYPFKKVSITFLPPISTKGKKVNEILEEVRDAIKNELDE